MPMFNVLMDALIGLMVLLTVHVHGLTGSTSSCTLYISIQHKQHEIGAQTHTFAYTLVKGIFICGRIRYTYAAYRCVSAGKPSRVLVMLIITATYIHMYEQWCLNV